MRNLTSRCMLYPDSLYRMYVLDRGLGNDIVAAFCVV